MQTTIKAVSLFACACLAAASGFAAQTSEDDARPYARVLATVVQPTEDEADAGCGALLELGASAGQDAGWEAAFTTGWVGWEQTETFGGDVVEADADLYPLLLGIRYRIPLGRESPVHLAVGPAAGWTYSSISGSATIDDILYTASASRWNFTWGGEAALVFTLSSIDLVAGYKFLSTDAGEVTLDGVEYDLGSVDTHVFYAGLGWRW
ncbi:MAG: outer membrane protein [Opitutaceae bacterium]